MTTPTLTFFNNKGGVGKTSLVYHLAWMCADLGKTVVMADLDPQANLTAATLTEEELDGLWNLPQGHEGRNTIYQCVAPLFNTSGILPPKLQKISTHLYLIPGDLALSTIEDELSQEWPKLLDRKNLYGHMLRQTALWQVMQMAAQEVQADIVFVDIGPNLGAINRSVLLGTDFVVLPLGADLFSLQGLRNLGPTLNQWREDWKNRLNNWEKNKQQDHEYMKHPEFVVPPGTIKPLGYLCNQPAIRLDRPIKAYDLWMQRIPEEYRRMVLNLPEPYLDLPAPANRPALLHEYDPLCLATLKHHRSLSPMAQEHRKPIFHLKPADGAIGAHANAVQDAKKHFKSLALRILSKCGITIDG